MLSSGIHVYPQNKYYLVGEKKCDNSYGSKQEWVCNKISAGLTVCLLHHWDSPHWASEHFLSYQTQLLLPLPQWDKGIPCCSARATSVAKAEHTAPPYWSFLCHFSFVQSLLGQGWPTVLQIARRYNPLPGFSFLHHVIDPKEML